MPDQQLIQSISNFQLARDTQCEQHTHMSSEFIPQFKKTKFSINTPGTAKTEEGGTAKMEEGEGFLGHLASQLQVVPSFICENL